MSARIEINKMKGRAKLAIEYAVRFGGIVGDHHKAWVIDQMVRALTGCTTDRAEKSDGGLEFKSKEYEKLVAEACAGDDGPDTYTWDEGIAP